MNELSLHILDILQNSIVAGAQLIQLIVATDTLADTLSITVEDNGCGMSPDFLQNVTSPFTTSRTTRSVGLGIPMFKQAAEDTGGHFRIESEQGVGTKLEAVFGYSHIDRAPMGALNDTVVSIIAMNPDIDLVFLERWNGAEYTLDTRALREVLGADVPLNTPDVIAWIRDDVQEGTESIHGGARI